MNKTTIGLLGAASALALAGSAQASPAPADAGRALGPARSFSELLSPIPNARALLDAENAQAAAQPTSEGSVELAQVYVAPPHHHHHHHHHHYRYYGYHHHPYHHHLTTIIITNPAIVIPLPQ